MSLPCGRIERFNFKTRKQSIFCDLLEELSGYLRMETVRFELSGTVEGSGLLGCDAVLLVKWFLMFQRHYIRSKHQKLLTLQCSEHPRRPEYSQETLLNCKVHQCTASPVSTFHFASLHSQMMARCGLDSSGSGYGQVVRLLQAW
jgi:hypothetical protein